MSMERLAGEEISDGTEKYDDSELVRILKKCQRECSQKGRFTWKITEEAYAMLHLICGDYKDGTGVKLAQYILTRLSPEPGEKITSNIVANSARTLKDDKDPYFIEWLKSLEKRKTKDHEKPEDDVFRR